MSGLGLQRRPSLWRQLDAASRYAWPAAFLVFGLLVIGLPLGLPGQAGLRPAYAMACVYFWSLYRPASLPAPIVALTGILLDLLGMSPLGLWAVLLLVLQGATLASRRRLIPLAFSLNWLVFCAFAITASAFAWLAQAALTLTILPAAPLAAQCLAACGFYPALSAIFIRAHRGAAAAELA
jgi:rod shape-determining protein MreD